MLDNEVSKLLELTEAALADWEKAMNSVWAFDQYAFSNQGRSLLLKIAHQQQKEPSIGSDDEQKDLLLAHLSREDSKRCALVHTHFMYALNFRCRIKEQAIHNHFNYQQLEFPAFELSIIKKYLSDFYFLASQYPPLSDQFKQCLKRFPLDDHIAHAEEAFELLKKAGTADPAILTIKNISVRELDVKIGVIEEICKNIGEALFSFLVDFSEANEISFSAAQDYIGPIYPPTLKEPMDPLRKIALFYSYIDLLPLHKNGYDNIDMLKELIAFLKNL